MGVIFARGFRSTNQIPPPSPTNKERIQDYRSRAPVELGNDRVWPWNASAFAPNPPTPEEVAEAFSFKYED